MDPATVKNATRRLALALDQLSIYADTRNLTSPAAGEPPITLGMLRAVVEAVFDGTADVVTYTRTGSLITATRGDVMGVGENQALALADLRRCEAYRQGR